MRQKQYKTTELPKKLADKLESQDVAYGKDQLKYAQAVKRPGGPLSKNGKKAKTGRKAPPTRKELRAKKRLQKKQNKDSYYKARNPNVTAQKPTGSKKNFIQNLPPKTATTTDKQATEKVHNDLKKPKLAQAKVAQKPASLSIEDDPEELILKDLEKKLGIKGSSSIDKYFGDDDLGSLLKGISVGSSSFRSSQKSADTSNTQFNSGSGKKLTPLAKKVMALKGMSADQGTGERSDSQDESDAISPLDNMDSDQSYSEDENEYGSSDQSLNEGFISDASSAYLDGNSDQDDYSESSSNEGEISESSFNGFDSSDPESDEELIPEDDVDSSIPKLSVTANGKEASVLIQQAYLSCFFFTLFTLFRGIKKLTEKQEPVDTKSLQTSNTKYIPPRLRAQMLDSDSESKNRIRKLVQGQLNRLSESNVERILIEIEKIYASNPRFYVTEAISNILLSSIGSKTNMIDTFLYVNAALVAALSRTIGVEASAYIVQDLVQKIDLLLKDIIEKSSTASSDSNKVNKQDRAGGGSGIDVDNDTTSKECLNLTSFLSELYIFNVISCRLVYHILQEAAAWPNETSVEIILAVIKTAGYQLRKDDPAMLKRLIELIMESFNKNDLTKKSARCGFMLEQLQNLRNNRMKQTMRQNVDVVQPLKKFLGNLDKKVSSIAPEPINVGLDDIRNVDTKGKWWLVGSYWAGSDPKADSEAVSGIGSQKPKNELGLNDQAYNDLMRLAKAFRMNTDVRRSIFISIMSSQDAVDAFEKCMKLGLKETQQREIIRVLILLVGQEEAYNHFYTLIAGKLCSVNHSFKVTLQYSLWDFLRSIGESSVGGLGESDPTTSMSASFSGYEGGEVSGSMVRKISNTAKMYAALVYRRSLDLIIFKTVTFTGLCSNAKLFFQLFFNALFTNFSPKAKQGQITSKHEFLDSLKSNGKDKLLDREQRGRLQEIVESASKVSSLASGLAFFLIQFVRNNGYCGEEHKQLVKYCSKFAKEILMDDD